MGNGDSLFRTILKWTMRCSLCFLMISCRKPIAMQDDPIANHYEAITVAEGIGHQYLSVEIAGEHDLIELARSGWKEDAWIFLGDKWIDVGYEENGDNVFLDLEKAASLLSVSPSVYSQNRAGNSEVTLYHIHPVVVHQNALSPPSAKDLDAFAHLRRQTRELLDADLKGVVIDGYGRWSFTIDDALEKRLLGMRSAYRIRSGQFDDTSVQAPYLSRGLPAPTTFQLECASRMRELSGSPQTPRSDAIDEYIRSMNELGVRLSYEKIE